MYELIGKIVDDFVDVYDYLQSNALEAPGYLSFESYIKYGKYCDLLTDCNPDGVINFASIMVNAGIPFQGQAYISDIRKVSEILGKHEFSPDDYDKYGLYRSEDIIDFNGSWKSVLREALGRKNDIKRQSIVKRKTIPPRLRYRVLVRDDFRCVLCGASPKNSNEVQLHIDHIIPVSKGGANSIDNLRTLCFECNIGKGDIMIENQLSDK